MARKRTPLRSAKVKKTIDNESASKVVNIMLRHVTKQRKEKGK